MSDQQTPMRAPRRARAIMNKMLESRIITPEGHDWLVTSTDPFHDTEIAPSGYPDTDTSRSITQCFVTTSQLNAPAGLSTPTWDAHVFFNPMSWLWAYDTEFTSPVPLTRFKYTRSGGYTVANNGTFLLAGYNAMSVPAGRDWVNDDTVSLTAPSYPICFPKQGSSGQFRLVACGFEVVNTTPELYRGGSVTVYRTPSTADRRVMAGASFEQVVLPPSTQSEAQLYPSARTWGAEDGCYVVGTLSSVLNNYKMAAPSYITAVKPMTAQQLTTPLATAPCFFYDNVSLDLVASRNARTLPFDNHGAIFTGLQPQATLQVTVRYYIERIPTSTNPELVVLTRPPSPYDPVALEIYSRVLTHLPVGVPVDQNPLGEWFNDIMSTLAEWGPKIGGLLGNAIPGAKMIGDAIGTVATGAKALNTGQPKKPPRRRPPPPKRPAPVPPQTTQRVSNQQRKKK